MNTTKTIILCAAAAACAAMAAETNGTAAAVSPAKEPSVPPAWIVSDAATFTRAEAGDADAMRTIAHGYAERAASLRIKSDDDERNGMLLESVKWLKRRAGIVAKDPAILSRAEAGDADAMKELADAYLYLAAARGAEASGDARKELFGKAMEWMGRRAETLVWGGGGRERHVGRIDRVCGTSPASGFPPGPRRTGDHDGGLGAPPRQGVGRLRRRPG